MGAVLSRAADSVRGSAAAVKQRPKARVLSERSCNQGPERKPRVKAMTKPSTKPLSKPSTYLEIHAMRLSRDNGLQRTSLEQRVGITANVSDVENEEVPAVSLGSKGAHPGIAEWGGGHSTVPLPSSLLLPYARSLAQRRPPALSEVRSNPLVIQGVTP